MDNIKHEKKALLYYKIAYKKLDRLTPLPFDCSELCNKRCCGGDKKGMYLFPFEYEFMQSQGFVIKDKVIDASNNIKLLMCEGFCDRHERPLACRIFPLFPYIDENNKSINVEFDLRGKSICPLQFQDIKEIVLKKRFKRTIKKVFKKLVKIPQIYDFCLLMTQEIQFLSRF